MFIISSVIRTNRSNNSISNELQTKFTEAETTLESIEVFRRNLIDKREKVAYKTGSCVKKNPTLQNSIESFLWTLANLSD